MPVRQGDGGGARQGDFFLGRAVQHVEDQSRVQDGLGVEAAQACQFVTGVEQTGIEEIGAGAPGLEGEPAEAQDVGGDGEVEKFLLIWLHAVDFFQQGSLPPSWSGPGLAGNG